MKILERGRLLWAQARPYLYRYRIPLMVSGGILLVFILTVQMLYPGDQALPRATVNGQAMGGKSYDELAVRALTSFEGSEAELKAADASKKIVLSDIGATADAKTAVNDLLHYPWWQRLIPLSIIVKKPELKTVEVTFDDAQLAAASETFARELSRPAEDAQLTISDGRLATTPAKTGHSVTAEVVSDTLKETHFQFEMTKVTLETEEQAPAISDDDIASIRAQAEKILERDIVIISEDGREFKAEPSDMTSWLTVSISDQNKPQLVAHSEQLAAYVNRLNDEVGTKPGTARATMVDGIETSRTSAPSGRAVASEELQEGIKKALFDESAPTKLTARMVDVPPVVEYSRGYTPSQRGLAAYAEYMASVEDIRIAVSEIGGKNWSAFGEADEQTVSASTYKLYVALMLFKQIHENKLQWNSGVLDTDAATCLERMIVQSDNPCAEEFLRMFDARQVNTYLYSKGISRATTVITEDGLARTTAADLQKVLRGIEDGSLIGGGDRSRLLELMGRQRYRAGIPAGSGGTVYDKVGFLSDYIHDAAIVKHSKGTYTIAILTQGHSWGKVAEITRQVERILYP